MKKIIILMLVMSMCIFALAALTSCNEEHDHIWDEGTVSVEPTSDAPGKKVFTCSVCGTTMTEEIPAETVGEHEHSYSSDWANNEIYHWHACTVKYCTETSEKTEHTWGEPEITKEAGDEADGELTFACTACEAKKVEAYKKEGISKDEWQSATDDKKFDNVTIYFTLKNGKETNVQVAMITETNVYRKSEITLSTGETNSWEQVYVGGEAEFQRYLFLETFMALLKEKDNYVYDPIENVYNAPAEVTAKIDMTEDSYAIETLKNGKVTFGADGKLECFVGQLTEAIYHGYDSDSMTCDMTVTFSDYGTTVVEAPDNTTTEQN